MANLVDVDAPPVPAIRRGVPPHILVVDDERLVRWSLRQRLEEEGYKVAEAEVGEEALKQFKEGVDLVLLDYALPDTNGMELLQTMKAFDPEVPVIMLTAHSSVEKAVEAMRRGAYHYARKPFNLDEVTLLVQKALETTSLRREVRRLGKERRSESLDGVIGESPAMQKVKTLLARIASSPASTVLLTGESGTGKDLAARAIHCHSERREQPFMNITCSALPETLLESELFGHERGAFTDAKQRKQGLLEQAAGGTVFLDEVAEMSPTLQAKLLRFLEERTFRRVGGSTEIQPDVRVIAATHRDLQQGIKDHQFRSDLYYRLAVLHVELPSLRERTGDVPLLTKFFVDRFNKEFHKKVRHVSSRAMHILEAHSWPGNIRELRNTVERAVLLADADTLGPEDFPIADRARSDGRHGFQLPVEGICFNDLEREFVVQALERTHGNQTRAARLLGMTRDQIRYRISKFRLSEFSATANQQ